jgi:hypothetical protein
VWLRGNELTLEHHHTDYRTPGSRGQPVKPATASPTIEVRSTDGTSFAIDYDPDGDIKP